MSVPQIYITTPIRNDGEGGRIPAVIRGQLTQFFEFKLRVPRKGYRTADLRVNLLSDELEPLYTTGDHLRTYANFLYVKWRSHVIFWGPILSKEVDFEGNDLTLHASDQGSRLEHHYFRIGDIAMDDPRNASKGHLTVNAAGIDLSLKAGEPPNSPDIDAGSQYIPLGVRMGSDHHTDYGRRIQIERGQEVWRTMLDLGDRTDGPLFEFVPLDISDGEDFAVCNVFDQVRDDISADVKFHYGTDLKNVRNMKLDVGGEVLSHAVVLTQDNRWRVLSISVPTGEEYGVWIQWEQVDFNLNKTATEADATDALGAVGDAVLDQYGRPLTSVEITLRRDDQIIDASDQFHWITDFRVGDIVGVKGTKGHESFSGKYMIDEVRLEQETDNSGQLRQAIDVIPLVTVGQYEYLHVTDFVADE